MIPVYQLPEEYVYPEPAWSPYLVGVLIGLLAVATLVIARTRLGASSGYADAAGMIGRGIAPQYTRSRDYFRKNPPMVSWTFLVVVGAVGGSLIAAWTGSELTGTFLQDLWIARFGSHSAVLRTVLAVSGGICMGYGARLAGGCTSGHGISGALQLSLGSWIALICFFLGGAVCAALLYRT